MWADEINDPEYQDIPEVTPTPQTTGRNKLKKKENEKYIPDYRELHFQPISSVRRPILDAITGEKSKYLIGSKDEKRFFCVTTQDPFDPKENVRLFFSSPKEYERFSGIKVSEEKLQYYYDNQKLFA
jgi:hypothetical protein